MKKLLLTAVFFTCALMTLAENIPVNEFRYAGPFPVKTPFIVDSVNVNSKTFDFASLLDKPLSSDMLNASANYNSGNLPVSPDADAIHLL